LTLCCVQPRIPAIRRRDNRLRSWQKPEAEERECDEKWWSCCFESDRVIHSDSFRFSAVLILRFAGLEEAKHLAERVLHLIQDRL
jgi:hypothetical protein